MSSVQGQRSRRTLPPWHSFPVTQAAPIITRWRLFNRDFFRGARSVKGDGSHGRALSRHSGSVEDILLSPTSVLTGKPHKIDRPLVHSKWASLLLHQSCRPPLSVKGSRDCRLIYVHTFRSALSGVFSEQNFSQWENERILSTAFLRQISMMMVLRSRGSEQEPPVHELLM